MAVDHRFIPINFY